MLVSGRVWGEGECGWKEWGRAEVMGDDRGHPGSGGTAPGLAAAMRALCLSAHETLAQ